MPLSHDEVVHGKGSLLGKMPGDRGSSSPTCGLLFGYQYAQPGKKLLFMGDDMACDMEWAHDDQLPWAILDRPAHEGVRRWVETLNGLVRAEPALHEVDFEPAGFEWIDASDTAASVLSFLRHPRRGEDGASRSPDARDVLFVANLTPVPRRDYGIGVPHGGHWVELANSDAELYGGSGWGNYGGVDAVAEPIHGRPYRLPLVLPPLSVVFLAPARPGDGDEDEADDIAGKDPGRVRTPR